MQNRCCAIGCFLNNESNQRTKLQFFIEIYATKKTNILSEISKNVLKKIGEHIFVSDILETCFSNIFLEQG